jgi:hypothetical protein
MSYLRILSQSFVVYSVRQQIRSQFNIICPSFQISHLRQLALKINLSNVICPQIPNAVPFENLNSSSETDEEEQSLGTLFLSYASEDRPFVEGLVSRLDKFAEKVWYDKREIIVGDSIAERISAGLTQATALIAVLSPNSVSKPWVLRELYSSLGRQLASAGINILPILIEKCNLPPILADIRYADFTTSFDVGFNELIAGLQGRRRSMGSS